MLLLLLLLASNSLVIHRLVVVKRPIQMRCINELFMVCLMLRTICKLVKLSLRSINGLI